MNLYICFIWSVERYEQMLKWKEMRKKQLEKEKKKRMPAFKTGVYQPSPPKYLVSGEQDKFNMVNLLVFTEKMKILIYYCLYMII